MGATVYSCCAGAAPQAAHERLAKDRLSPARRAWADRYSGVLLDTVDWCLRLDHLERPQSVLALQKALLGEKEPEHKGENGGEKGGEARFIWSLKNSLGLRGK